MTLTELASNLNVTNEDAYHFAEVMVRLRFATVTYKGLEPFYEFDSDPKHMALFLGSVQKPRLNT